MNVKELIDHLSAMPQDALVIYRYQSDYDVLEAGEVKLVQPKEKKIARRRGKFVEAYPERQWGDEVPEFVQLVVFPGN